MLPYLAFVLINTVYQIRCRIATLYYTHFFSCQGTILTFTFLELVSENSWNVFLNRIYSTCWKLSIELSLLYSNSWEGLVTFSAILLCISVCGNHCNWHLYQYKQPLRLIDATMSKLYQVLLILPWYRFLYSLVFL